MSRLRDRKRPVHHEDVAGLNINALRALAPRTTAVPAVKPVVAHPVSAIVPSALKSAVSALSKATGGITALKPATTPVKAGIAVKIDAATAQKAKNAAAKISSSTSRLRASAQKNKKLSGKLNTIAKALDNKAAKVRQAAQMSGGSSM